MKKIKSPTKYNNFLRQRHKKRKARREKHRQRLERWKSHLQLRQQLISKSFIEDWLESNRQIVKAPKDFSLIREPEATLLYLNDVDRLSEAGKIVMCDVSDIEDLSTDAIVAMIAFSNNPKIERKGRILGNTPNNPQLADKFRDSGVFGSRYFRFSDGALRQARGTIFRSKSNEVKGQIASELIKFSTEHLFGKARKLKGVYATMIECMNNTFNHATLDEENKAIWWATVYYDEEQKIAFFNFLDNGIGILESLNLKWQDNLQLFAGLKNNADLMREVLQGKIGSRTGLSYRGNGLPEIHKRFQRGQLSRLIIITNDVYVDVENDEYRTLPKSFDGTFFHWEISYDKHFEQRENENLRSH